MSATVEGTDESIAARRGLAWTFVHGSPRSPSSAANSRPGPGAPAKGRRAAIDSSGRPCKCLRVGSAGDLALPPRRLASLLKRAGVTERRRDGGGDLFSAAVLLVDSGRLHGRGRRRGREVASVYDQEGTLRATISAPVHDNSVIRTVFFGAAINQVVVDIRDEVLLGIRLGRTTFTALAAGGTEVATVKRLARAPGFRRLGKQVYEVHADGEPIGCVRVAGRSAWSVHDAEDNELARVASVPPRFGWLWYSTARCNVIEIDDRMPDALRPMVFALSALLFARAAAAG